MVHVASMYRSLWYVAASLSETWPRLARVIFWCTAVQKAVSPSSAGNVSILARYQLLEVGTMASASEVLILEVKYTHLQFALWPSRPLVTNVTRLTALTCGSGHLTVPPSKNWSWFFVVQMPFMFSLAGWSSLSQQPLHHGWLFHGNFGISQNFSATSWSTLRKSIMHQANSLRFSAPTKATCEPA